MSRLLLCCIAILTLNACSTHYLSSSNDTNNAPTHTLHHTEDKKGRESMPSFWQSQGLRTFVYSPQKTAWAVYNERGARVKTGRGSGGKHWCEDENATCHTVTGRFKIYAKKGVGCESGKYPLETNGGAPMPYCQHFHQGYALHGSDHVPDYNASHGCIRVLPSAAKWLHSYLQVGSQVVVQSY